MPIGLTLVVLSTDKIAFGYSQIHFGAVISSGDGLQNHVKGATPGFAHHHLGDILYPQGKRNNAEGEMPAANTIDKKDVRQYVAALARRRGVVYAKTGNDALAEAITRLADDDVRTDETEDLLVALKRAHVIDGPTMVSLLGQHLDECRHV
ncbi:conserved hypothetical protein [Acidithiobacillus ferrivorans]|uniref:Uncharacterized protein n=2 Tax=Acidithiobacillus ferrivorans TaxID=160808 RepID=A0A060UUK0_9PROT|nr:conserved hypothetical protein [Acidithiobacillus ferrivorans]